MITAVVPARCGSKRVPEKNYRKLLHQPLIDWTLEFALGVFEIDHIIVATDCLDLIQNSNFLQGRLYEASNLQEGESVQVSSRLSIYRRAKANAQDSSRTYDLIEEIFRVGLINSELLLLLQPTSPLRTYEEFKQALRIFRESNSDSLFSIKVAESPHPLKCFTVGSDGKIGKVAEEFNTLTTPEISLPTYFAPDGAYYISRLEWLLQSKTFLGINSRTFLRTSYTVNIDTELDFKLAELLARDFKGK